MKGIFTPCLLQSLVSIPGSTRHPTPNLVLLAVKDINFAQLLYKSDADTAFSSFFFISIHLFLNCEDIHKSLPESLLNFSIQKYQNLLINISKGIWFSPFLFLQFLLKGPQFFFRHVLCLCVELLSNPSFSFHTRIMSVQEDSRIFYQTIPGISAALCIHLLVNT